MTAICGFCTKYFISNGITTGGLKVGQTAKVIWEFVISRFLNGFAKDLQDGGRLVFPF